MNILGKSFFFFFFLDQAKSFLTDVETRIFLNLVKNNYVKDCFIAPKDVTDATAVKILKALSEIHVFTAFLKKENLRKHLEKMDMTVYRCTAIVLKEESLNSVDYFSNKTIISSYFWFLFDASNGTLRRELVLTEIPHDAVLFVIKKIKTDNYIISEYFKIKRHVPGVIQFIAEWKNGSLSSTGEHWYSRRSNMHQYEFVTVKFNESLYLTPKEKVNEAVWEELSEILNFTIKPKLVQYQPNKPEDLESEEEEALLDTQIYIGKNEKFRHLLGPTSQSGLYMHIKAAGEYKGLIRFIKPFSKYTWLSIGCWVCCCGFFEFLVEYLSRTFGCSEKPYRESFRNAFTPLDSLCNQNGVDPSSNLSCRFLLFVIRISAVLIYYAYAATFISYLLLYIPQLPFTDLMGFVEDGTYKIIGERNSDIDTYFNISEQPLERLVHKKFLFDITQWSRLDKEVDRICKGEKLVLVAYDDDIEKYKPCNIVKIKKPLKIVVNGFKIRFRSPFRGLLHIKLLLMRTTGILGRMNHHILHQNFKKFTRNESYEISMEKVLPVFILLQYGWMVSTGILALEFIFARLTALRCRDQKHANRILMQRTSKNILKKVPLDN